MASLIGHVRRFLISHPLRITAIFTVIVLLGLWAVYIFPEAEASTMQWTLSALTQSAAAILGLLVVGLVFAIEQAGRMEETLKALVPKYLDLLWGGKAALPECGAIEVLRKACAGDIAKDHLGDVLCDPGGYPLRRPRTKKGLLLAISKLAYGAAQHVNPSWGVNALRRIEIDLKQSGLDESDFNSVLVDEIFLRSNPRDFFELLGDVFNYANETLLSYPMGEHLVGAVWEESWYKDGVAKILSRLRVLDFFSGRSFKAVMTLFVATVVASILILSGTSTRTFVNPWVRIASGSVVLLFTVSMASFLVVLQPIITSAPRSHVR